MSEATIGVDVGATTISGGLVTHAGDILHVEQVLTRGTGSATVVERLHGVIGELLGAARTAGLSLDGIGVGIAGVIDPERGAMRFHAKNGLPELAHLPLARELARGTGLPAFVDNDANALALAEWRFGVARGAHSLALLALGTGVGGGMIVGDSLIRGHNGHAGEFHGVPVNFDGPPGAVGRGLLGEYVGGEAIAAAARAQVAAGAGALLGEMAGGDAQAITSELVFRAARAGDLAAKAIVDRAYDALAAAIAFIANSLNPEVIVVTGGVARSLVGLEDELRARAGQYAVAAALAGTRLHVIGGDKRQTVRGGAALVCYELRRAASPARA
jgi:glucokinase